MAISRDVFLSILAMDSYNRGYNPGIQGFSQLNGAKLGQATVIANAQDAGGVAQAASFYALAYNMTGVAGFSSGEKVIAYRGTDQVGPSWQEWTLGDAWNGWFIGAGTTGSAQAKLAVDFYNSVVGTANVRTADVTMTGHSLGGGLTGFVSTLYGRKGVAFDNDNISCEKCLCAS
jgi:hypothetical protein